MERTLSEIQIQASIWTTIWKEIPELRRCLFHVPNESTYDDSQQASSGVIPGIQDMILLCRGKTYMMELKDDTGRIDMAQKVAHAAHAAQHIMTWVFYADAPCIEFIRCCWYDPGHLYLFDQFISPYAKSELLDGLILEQQEKKKKARENKAARNAAHNAGLKKNYQQKFRR